uniref:RHS repeat-associated core domain-containing protein n=1 Tax=Yersinia frederiksenii TaxID=29484 RepID=UPI001F4BDCDF|nr:RHS repeat-associated core domain-containing protein [Yersinia frederiksenii]ULG19841.1 insecticidal toxin complex protein C [Yersinia frederiksenii]
MSTFQPELCENTPSVTVFDNRGLTIHKLQYYRHPDSLDMTDERISHYQYDDRGFLTQITDPRLYVLQQTDSTVNPNIKYLTSLSGDVLRSNSVDAGTTVVLNDIAGRPYWAESATGVIRTWQYEDDTLPGRLLAITERQVGGNTRITERLVWGGNTQTEKSLNLAGQCTHHYDSAGLSRTDSIALTGAPLSVTRQLLPDSATTDWQGGDELAWQDLLDAEIFTTQSTADATGAILTQTDAMGNVQRQAYDVAGQLKGSWLTQKEGTERVIVKSLTYSAAGQKLREEHGNGVVSTWSYEAETQRLIGINIERPSNHPLGTKILQQLRYEYDPVGNVLQVNNDAEASRYWRNQKVLPGNSYAYDSLYQLITATGREMVNIGQQGTSRPPAFIPLPTDNNTYTTYTRSYSYDRGGNLTQIRHSAPASGNNYTTNITVSSRSNRAVLNTLTSESSMVDALFDAGGHQNQLQPGQNLTWTPQGELLKVTLVERNGQSSDYESYRYDSASQRVTKINTLQSGNNSKIQHTLYLSGLEQRITLQGDTVKEVLHVVTTNNAVRMLHWEDGKPGDIDNDQLRYSYDNLVGSIGLEVDAEGNIISLEEYYPYGGTAIWAARSQTEANYKTLRYSGQEQDATGLYYYGFRYYQPWIGRWLSADPAGYVDGINLYRMVGNNPVNSKDIAGLVRAEDLPDSVLLAIGYKEGPYTKEQNRLYGYRKDGQRKLLESGWVDDPKINTFSPEIFVAAKGANNELLARSAQEKAFDSLTVDEMAIITLYSQESLPFHAWTAKHNLDLPVRNEYQETYNAGQTGELARALNKLPNFRGMSYRGALLSNTFYAETDTIAQQYQQDNPNATVFKKGSLVTTHGFFSTSRSPEVASQFVFRQRFGNTWSPNTVLFNIIGNSGRNIAQLAELQQAEILLSPGATFNVTGVTRTDFGYHVNLLEVNAEKTWQSGVQIRDYQRGYTKGRKPNTANY